MNKNQNKRNNTARVSILKWRNNKTGRKMIELEICAASIESVLEAKKGGAKRVELCANLNEGGTTPPLSWIEESMQIVDIEIFALIRPRGGDFLYSDIEYSTMKRDIIHCGETGCHGVVLGILTKEGKVDSSRCEGLIRMAKSYNMSVTFHRAIDRTEDILGAMEDIINLGCYRILTSGGRNTAMEGKETIKEMIEQAKNRIIIMPGSGINENNIVELSGYLDTNEFHGSFRVSVDSAMDFENTELADYESEYKLQISSAERIKTALVRVNKI